MKKHYAIVRVKAGKISLQSRPEFMVAWIWTKGVNGGSDEM